MNRKLISLSILFLIVYISIQSCQNHTKNESLNATVKIESLYDKLSKFYIDTTFNGIYIYPDTTYVDSIFVFKERQSTHLSWRYCLILPLKT